MDRIDETRFSERNLNIHHDRHTSKTWSQYFRDVDDELLEPMSKKEYDDSADELSKQPVYSSDLNSKYDVVGFVGTRGRIIKYRKSTNELVVYVADLNDAATITYYKTGNNYRYKRLRDKEYLREIKPEDDYYNI